MAVHYGTIPMHKSNSNTSNKHAGTYDNNCLPGVVVLVEGAVREVEGPGPALVDVRASVVVLGVAAEKNITDPTVLTGLFQQVELHCMYATN